VGNGVQCGTYRRGFQANAGGATTSNSGYSRAGCCLQSSTSKGDAADAYAQVVIYGLWVTHA
jgi:hypothetical protein